MVYCDKDILGKDQSMPKSKEFTLYVNNLPAELNEHGFLQIFSHYGHVKGHFYRQTVSWAYITYGTYNEAESAIKDLHDVPPLCLKVSFAKDKKLFEANIRKTDALSNAKDNYEKQDASYGTVSNKPLMHVEECRNPLHISKNVQTKLGLPECSYVADDTSYPHTFESCTYNPHRNTEYSVGILATGIRSKVTVTQDGKRHILHGHEPRMYEIPDPCPTVHNMVDKLFEERTSGLYRYGKDTLQDAVGECKFCSKKTIFSCERCYTFYCSRTCQVANWQQHKLECENIPALVPAMRSIPTPVSNSKGLELDKDIFSMQASLRRLETLPHERSSSNEINQTTSKEQRTASTEHNNSILRKAPPAKEVQINDNANSEELNSVECNINKYQNFNVDNIQRMEDDIPYTTCTFLSETKFENVKVIASMNRDIWVQKVDKEHYLRLFTKCLSAEASDAPKVEPTVGNVYAVTKENIWCRALITSLNPLMVHYIDYGTSDYVKTNDFREISNHKKVPRFSAKIRLTDKVDAKLKNSNQIIQSDDILCVRMVSVDFDGIILVEILDESNIKPLEVNPKNKNLMPRVSTNLVDNKFVEPLKSHVNETVQSPKEKLNSIVDMVTVGEKGILEVYEKVENNAYSILLLPVDATSNYEKLLYDLPSICDQEAQHSNEKSNVGDLICGRRLDGNWLRGYILFPEPPLKMGIIDEARIMQIDKIVACPTEFLTIPAYGVVCEVMDPRCQLQADDQYKFQVTRKIVNEEQNAAEIEIFQGQEIVKAIIKHWMPISAQNPLKYVPLKNGSKVCLTAFPRPDRVFVRPIDTAAEEYYNHVMRKVDKCAKLSSFLKQRPVIRQMVLARFLDDIFYRAIVVSCDQTRCSVFYIDIGYIMPVDIHQLKSSSDDLEYLPCCIAEVKLKDVPKNLPIGDYLRTYIEGLLEQQTSLTYWFDGTPSKDGVYLDIDKKTTLNAYIINQLLPISKDIDPEDKTCYMMNDISIMELGNVGDTIKVFMLQPVQNKYNYAVLKLDYELLSTIMITMPEKMTEYGESSNPYIPRVNELCLVCCKGSWHRAVCEYPNYGRTTSMVYCIDSGKTEIVNHTNMRLMPRKFLTPNAAANIIDISHMVPTNSNGRFSDKIEEMISQILDFGKFVTVKIIDLCPKSEIYKVTIPEIEKILRSDRLL